MSAKETGDWRDGMLERVRTLVRKADAAIEETVKWRKLSNPDGVPVWARHGMVCTGEKYRDKVKLTFAQGAHLDDPAGLFNASLDAGTRRAIDIRRGDNLDAEAFVALVRAGIAHNAAHAKAAE